jgi:hypothetical protein
MIERIKHVDAAAKKNTSRTYGTRPSNIKGGEEMEITRDVHEGRQPKKKTKKIQYTFFV